MNEEDLRLLDAFADRLWLEDGLSRNTLESYRRDLVAFAQWLDRMCNKPLMGAERGDLEHYLAERFRRQARPRSISRLVASLRRLYRYAVREGRIHHDPTLQLASPKLPCALPKSLSEAEVEALLQAPNTGQALGLRDRAMLETLYATGLRV